MKKIGLKTNCALALVIAGILAAGQAVADKPSWAGSGKGEKGEHREKSEQGRQRDGDGRARRDDARSSAKMREHFGERHRTIVHEYYSEQFRSGRCPPVIYYEVPPVLVVQFGQPPSGYRYVRVASDILLIALGTGMVIDAIQDLGRM